MATTPIDWQDAVTFEEYVLRLLQEGKTESEEFKALMRIFGKTKIDGYFKKHQERSGSARLNASDTPHTKSHPADSICCSKGKVEK